jgi:hypothetical protein
VNILSGRCERLTASNTDDGEKAYNPKRGKDPRANAPKPNTQAAAAPRTRKPAMARMPETDDSQGPSDDCEVDEGRDDTMCALSSLDYHSN